MLPDWGLTTGSSRCLVSSRSADREDIIEAPAAGARRAQTISTAATSTIRCIGVEMRFKSLRLRVTV
jgi:hypothetical protein